MQFTCLLLAVALVVVGSGVQGTVKEQVPDKATTWYYGYCNGSELTKYAETQLNKEYSELDTAITDCKNNSNCKGIYDYECKGVPPYFLCEGEPIFGKMQRFPKKCCVKVDME